MASSLRALLAAPSILTAQKSFANAAVGSAAWNAQGLHVWRVRRAHAMAARRRARLAARMDAAEREAFDRDGFVVRRNALPREALDAIRREVETRALPAWEMRQGEAVDRVSVIPSDGAMGGLWRWLGSPGMRATLGYVAGHEGHCVSMLQTIAVDPVSGAADPQADLHADTFHPNAKYWLFLDDVPEDAGPFAYVPGSHRLNEARLAWEGEQARTAGQSENGHHAGGSLRVPEALLPEFGLHAPRPLPVEAGTLVIADTYGLHRRTPSRRATIRASVYGMQRRNPFVPWNGLDPLDAPGLRRATKRLFLAAEDLKARRGRPATWVRVDDVPMRAPQQR